MLPLYFAAAAAAAFLAFFIVYKKNRARMVVGYLFCIFLLLAGTSFVLWAATMESRILNVILVAGAFAVMGVFLFGVYVLAALLFLNARLVFKRERRSLQNSLTLLLGLGLVAYIIASFFIRGGALPFWVQCVWFGLTAVLTFYFFHIFVFLTSCLLVNFSRPAKRQHYVIVLGSGLIGGHKVPPLLAARINKAIRFYHKQAAKRTPPKLIMSGGQGPNESISEAEAMRDYALLQGVPAKDILLEANSKTTEENMRFSKELIAQRTGEDEAPRAIFATSNYHVFRAGIFSHRAGLSPSGLGAKTALYYLPNALLREYIAFFAMHKLRLLIFVCLLFVAAAFLNAFPVLMAPYIG